MIVADLIKLLQKQDPNRLVVMASDAEGNSYSPLSDISTAAYRAETTWSGEVGLDHLTESDRNDGYTEDDLMEDGELALILHPVN